MIPRGRAPRDRLPLYALALISLAAAPQSVSDGPFQDVVGDLAARIVAAAAPLGRAQLVPRDSGARGPGEHESVARQLARELTSRGVAIAEQPDGAAIVTYTCSQNVRSFVCAADVQKDGTRYSVLAERRKETRATRPNAIPLILSIEPVFSQAAPILDLVALGSRLVVLDPLAVAVYEQHSEGWRLTTARPIAANRPWPRDIRGRLRVDGSSLEAFLPGTICRGTLDPLTFGCAEDQRPWPIGVDNNGIPSGSNAFTDQHDTVFFSGADLGPDAGAHRLIAAQNGLAFLDDNRRPTPVKDDDLRQDDQVASLKTTCAGTQVLVASAASTFASLDGAQKGQPYEPRPRGREDTLRVFNVTAMQFTAMTPPTILPGTVTALWPTADAGRVLVVSRNAATGTYEAFHASVSCGR